MALFQFNFLVTCFGLTVWTHAPFLVLALTYAFQGICYISDIDVPNYDEYIWWTFLTALAGVVLGWALLIVTRAPRMLRFEVSYVGVWGKFILWLILYLAAELFYNFFPPPAYPWGIIGTSIAHLILQVGLWVVMYYNIIVFAKYNGTKYFFGLWALVLFVVEVSFFLAYAMLERWAAYAATGIGAAILLVAALLFPLAEPYRRASAVAGEPLIGPVSAFGQVPGDSKNDRDDDVNETY
jgi:hypothetical protein